MNSAEWLVGSSGPGSPPIGSRATAGAGQPLSVTAAWPEAACVVAAS